MSDFEGVKVKNYFRYSHYFCPELGYLYQEKFYKMIKLFYILLLPTILTGLLFLYKTLAGTVGGYTSLSEKIATVIASSVLLGGGYYGWYLAIKQGQPGFGSGVLILSWVVFILIMLISGLNNTKSWN